MGFTTLERMKSALLDVRVTRLERVVLLDMAVAVDDDSTLYSWGHDRLALAIGKTPGSSAARQALGYRIIPALIAKGLIELKSSAYRGHNAEYELLVLSGMGNGRDSECVTVPNGMGNGSEPECVSVSERMGNGLSVTPLPTHYPFTDIHTDSANDEQITDHSSSSAHDLDDTTTIAELIETATVEQIDTLSDLYSQRSGATTPPRYVEGFRAMTRSDADERIAHWRQRLAEDSTTEHRVARV